MAQMTDCEQEQALSRNFEVIRSLMRLHRRISELEERAGATVCSLSSRTSTADDCGGRGGGQGEGG